MKYIVENMTLMKIMEEFFHKNFPEIKLPMTVTQNESGLVTRYFNNENDDETLFAEYDDKLDHINNKWFVNSNFETIYNFFGEENFENFVKYYFGLDITEKGNKKYNWLFD